MKWIALSRCRHQVALEFRMVGLVSAAVMQRANVRRSAMLSRSMGGEVVQKEIRRSGRRDLDGNSADVADRRARASWLPVF